VAFLSGRSADTVCGADFADTHVTNLFTTFLSSDRSIDANPNGDSESAFEFIAFLPCLLASVSLLRG
jgi:hypothetical protein